jgi:hypothetical protein
VQPRIHQSGYRFRVTALQFVASLIHSLAWPTVVLVISVIFRRQLSALLARPFRSLKAGPLEVVWDRQIAEAEAELGGSAVTLSGGPPPTAVSRTSDQLGEVVRVAPTAAVLQAFAGIERQLRELLVRSGLAPVAGSALQLARQALDADLIRPETVSAVEGLAVLRNLVAHGREAQLDAPRARDYLALTDAVSYALKSPPFAGDALGQQVSDPPE